MSRPKVSIITRTRDREIFLARAMASVLGQAEAPSWEWIVVNDAGNRDKVESILGPAMASHSGQVVLIHLGESKGMENASNRGMEKATGEYVVIHDDDDTWEPTFLKEMAGWMDIPGNRPFGGVVCHSHRIEEVVGGESIIIERVTPFNDWLTHLDPWTILEENPFPPISFLFRRSTYDEAGPFDESLPVLGDWEFNVRVILGKPIGILPRTLARYHHRPRAQSGASANSITAGHNTHRHWESVLRRRWMESLPAKELPEFGYLAKSAGSIKESRDRLNRLLSLPIRPGPQV